jgi:histidinol phosphatase-like PHP family hydrolase
LVIASIHSRFGMSRAEQTDRIIKAVENPHSRILGINPDAHSTEEIDNVRWGVLMARKGTVPRDRVLNALTLPQFRAHLERRKTSPSPRKRPLRVAARR